MKHTSTFILCRIFNCRGGGGGESKDQKGERKQNKNIFCRLNICTDWKQEEGRKGETRAEAARFSGIPALSPIPLSSLKALP